MKSLSKLFRRSNAETTRGLAPSSTETVIRAYYGHHKCGTTWILSLLKEICASTNLRLCNHEYTQYFDGDIRAYRRAHPFDVWCYTSADYVFVRPLDTIGFHVVRDPRDVVVSGYFSHLQSHPDAGWPRLRFFRPYLQSLSKEDGLMCEMLFSGIYLQQLLSWDYEAKPSILEIRFEDMTANPFGAFQKILTHLGLMERLGQQNLSAILQRNTFEKLSGGRSPGQEDRSSHYRLGIPGDWRNHFTKEHVAYFKSLYNPLLLKLGYEDREDW
jgi:Sulfotransferase domain